MSHVAQQDAPNVVSVVRLGRSLAAEIQGVDLSQPLNEASFAAIHHAFLENEGLIFRDQDISADDMMSFGRRFGPLSIHPFSPTMSDRPELIVLDHHAANRRRHHVRQHVGGF